MSEDNGDDARRDAPSDEQSDVPHDASGNVTDDTPSDASGDAPDAVTGDEPGERDAPLSDLATGVREREAEREHESDPDFDELFEAVDVEGVDGEQAWRDLLAEEEGEPLAVGERVQTDENRDVRRIENRTCHNCQYFGEPPTLHCTHEGTEIRRVVDTDHYEVVDCPMVVDEEEFEIPETE